MVVGGGRRRTSTERFTRATFRAECALERRGHGSAGNAPASTAARTQSWQLVRYRFAVAAARGVPSSFRLSCLGDLGNPVTSEVAQREAVAIDPVFKFPVAVAVAIGAQAGSEIESGGRRVPCALVDCQGDEPREGLSRRGACAGLPLEPLRRQPSPGPLVHPEVAERQMPRLGLARGRRTGHLRARP